MPAAIDTLRFSKRLEAAGMAQPQAEAIAEAVSEGMAEGLATKQDLAEVNHGVTELRAEVNHGLAELRTEMATTQELTELRTTAQHDIAALRTEMAKMEARIIRWNIGTIIAMTAVFATVVKLL